VNDDRENHKTKELKYAQISYQVKGNEENKKKRESRDILPGQIGEITI
jgi:hypothetical protein